MVSTPLSIRPRISRLESLYRLLDAMAIVAGLLLSVWAHAPWDMLQCWTVGPAGVVAFMLAAEFTALYRGWRGARAEREVLCALVTWLLAMTALLMAGYLSGNLYALPRRVPVSWFFAGPALIALNRILIRASLRLVRKQGWNCQRYAIAGVNELGIQLVRNIEQLPELGLELVGFFDDRPDDRTTNLPEEVGERKGDMDDLIGMCRNREVDRVYISLPMRAEQRIRQDLLEKLADTTASVYIIPDFFVFELLHARWTDIGGLPAVSVVDHPFYGVDGVLKHTSDLLLGGLILLLLAVPMTVVALLVKYSSPGPIFFRQRRYGLDGHEVRVWKFRSMTVCEDGAQVQQATRNDQRITRIGRILRKTSIDELPQLFNVIAGSMSLVGPRPHATAHNEQYRKLIPGYMLRHKVKPGITGLAQVNGFRGETDTLEKMQRRVEYDHRYIRDWSIWLDLKILVRTAFVAWSDKNAY